MGRGRAKAKQAKVARQLKYSGGGTDLDRLRAELGVGTDNQRAGDQPGSSGGEDRYAVDDDEDDSDLDDTNLDDEVGRDLDDEELDDPAAEYDLNQAR